MKLHLPYIHRSGATAEDDTRVADDSVGVTTKVLPRSEADRLVVVGELFCLLLGSANRVSGSGAARVANLEFEPKQVRLICCWL